MSDISDICGVVGSTIKNWLNKFNIERQYKYRNKKWLKEKTEEGLWQVLWR